MLLCWFTYIPDLYSLILREEHLAFGLNVSHESITWISLYRDTHGLNTDL